MERDSWLVASHLSLFFTCFCIKFAALYRRIHRRDRIGHRVWIVGFRIKFVVGFSTSKLMMLINARVIKPNGKISNDFSNWNSRRMCVLMEWKFHQNWDVYAKKSFYFWSHNHYFFYVLRLDLILPFFFHILKNVQWVGRL